MLDMPLPKADILSRAVQIASDLRGLVADPEAVITEEDRKRPYETDALTAYKQMPLMVVLPSTTAEVSAIMTYCHTHGIRVVARGAGTSLAGGALPLEDAIVLGISRLNRVLEISPEDRLVRVEAGITNIAVTRAVQPFGFFYAPDPSSQLACTIAGNVAMNSGGAHCLKYGVTTNNLLGAKMVLADGQVVEIGHDHMEPDGYDWMGLICGSEGQLGIVTEMTLRILPTPQGARPLLLGFASNEQAGACVDAIIGSGIIPVALEFMDRPAVHAAEDFAKAGYPLDVEALLIVEVEGSEAEIDSLLDRIKGIAEGFDPQHVSVATDKVDAENIWKGRKSAFGAVGRISPDYMCMDGTIPTSKLPEVLKRMQAMAQEEGFQVANIFHAGDGNLHPLILFDANLDGELERVEAFGGEILKLCVDVGGCLTGEHGVGVEKRELMSYQYDQASLDQQKAIKTAFDPDWLLNPHKVFPFKA
ncbi:MAG: FAD-linked oxidase C-terminal domain-containing protein [Alphaproteobacteria bacterium]